MKNYLLLGIIFCSLLTFGQDYRAVWQQCYGDEGDNHYTAICPTSDGYYLLTTIIQAKTAQISMVQWIFGFSGLTP